MVGARRDPQSQQISADGRRSCPLATFIVGQYKRLNKLFDDACDYATKSIADKLARRQMLRASVTARCVSVCVL